jgi:hypothetical protein
METQTVLTQQEYLIKLLTQLQDEWPLAEWLLLVLNQPDADPSVVETLLQVMVDAMHATTTQLSAQKIAMTQTILHKIQDLESIQHEADIQEIDGLLEHL